jgi:hypothetical protein
VTDPRVLAIYKGVGTHDPAWDDFTVFRDWAHANGYADNLSIDRIDNAGGYWPDNCRWITIAAQQRNKTSNVIIEVAGEKMILAEAGARFGLNPETISKRIRLGWPHEEAVLPLSRRQVTARHQRYSQPFT